MGEAGTAEVRQGDLDRLLGRLRQEMPMLRERYRVSYMGVFGSYVRGEEEPTSDIDVLVEFEEPPSLLKYIELEHYLSDVLGAKVDLVMRSALKPHIGRRILQEVVPV